MTWLSPESEQAFDAYVKTAEAKMGWKARLQPKAGAIAVAAAGGTSAITDIKYGIIHDWVAATLVPGATVEKVLAVLQNYENYKNTYTPDVTDSTVLGRDGNRWHVFLQLRKKKVLTVLLNSEYTVDYVALEAGRWSVVSHSTKIAEVDGGRELAPGRGYGFLWRINVYWLLEPRPEGVYMETRAISLSRDVPPGLAWAIKPMIKSVTRESLQETLAATVGAALKTHFAPRIPRSRKLPGVVSTSPVAAGQG
jgi:hypothetical protein